MTKKNKVETRNFILDKNEQNMKKQLDSFKWSNMCDTEVYRRREHSEQKSLKK